MLVAGQGILQGELSDREDLLSTRNFQFSFIYMLRQIPTPRCVAKRTGGSSVSVRFRTKRSRAVISPAAAVIFLGTAAEFCHRNIVSQPSGTLPASALSRWRAFFHLRGFGFPERANPTLKSALVVTCALRIDMTAKFVKTCSFLRHSHCSKCRKLLCFVFAGPSIRDIPEQSLSSPS